jgi:23S rRNA G2445 N2-methylase RlmL
VKSVLITNKGIEDNAKKEIKELIKVDATIKDTVLLFEAKKPDDLCKLCYKSQTARKILILLQQGSVKKLDDISIEVDLLPYLKDTKTFGIECIRLGEQDFKSVDVESKIIHLIAEAYEKTFTHENPDIIFFAYVYNDDFYFGIDLAGFDLAKRSYKIFNAKNSLKGPVGYEVIRTADYKKKETLVITASKDGVLPIEAAHYASGLAVNFYNKEKFIFHKYKFLKIKENLLETFDKKPTTTKIIALDSSNHNLTLTKKNAKIAGVDKLLSFSRMDLQWLDTKFESTSVDKIIGMLPSPSKHRTAAEAKKIYKEFFHQTAFILKPKGLIVTLTPKNDLLKEVAAEYNLKQKKEKTVAQGQTEFYVTVFSK